MLESFTCSTFQPHVGDTFTLHVDEGTAVDATLIEATELPVVGGERDRTPFSLIFLGSGPVLPQRIYGLEHSQLGAIELFLVPVASDAKGTQYQAIFT
jgi:hypothetical protein